MFLIWIHIQYSLEPYIFCESKPENHLLIVTAAGGGGGGVGGGGGSSGGGVCCQKHLV